MLTEISSTGWPITLGEAKRELRMHGNEFDRLVLDNLERAIRYVENRAQLTLRTTVQRKLSVPNWPDYDGDGEQPNCTERWPAWQYRVASPILLTHPKWATTDSVTYFDLDDSEQTVNAANYNTRGSDTAPAELEFDEYYVFPSLRTRKDAVNITYTTGSSDPDPVGITAAHLMLKFLFDGDKDKKTAADELIGSLRNKSYGAA